MDDVDQLIPPSHFILFHIICITPGSVQQLVQKMTASSEALRKNPNDEVK